MTSLPRKRTVLILATLLLLIGITVVVWEAADWPPPRLILKYGWPPTGGPTGRTKVIEGIEFVELKPGYFRMGSHYYCRDGDLLGRLSSLVGLNLGDPPRHHEDSCFRWVEVTGPFWITRTEVTNQQFETVFPAHPRHDESSGDRTPVTMVSFEEAVAWCEAVGSRSGLALRLPSDPEWEFACRAGTTTAYSFGDDPGGLARHAWYQGNSGYYARETGTRRANPWGLHDLHGNVVEYCTAGTSSRRFAAGRLPDRHQPVICRGGWYGAARHYCRSGHWGSLDSPDVILGFRPAFTLPEDE